MSKVFDILRIYALVLGALFILTGTFMGVIFITGGLDYPPWAVFAAMVILYAIGSTVIYGIVRPGGYYILVTHPGPYGWDARRPPARRVPGIGARGWEGGPWAGTRHPYGFPVHPPHPGTVHGRPGRASPRQRHTMPYQWRGRPGGGPYVTGVRPDAAGGRWDPWWATTTPHWEWHSRDEKIPLNRWDLPRPLTLLAIFVFSVILGTTLLVLGRGDPVMYLGFPAAFIIAFSFPSLIWISYVYEREYSLEPRRGMLIALAWGMLSTNIAIVLEMASGVNDLLLMAVVVAPVVEEAVKPMGLWFLRRSINGPLEGLVYGVTCGMGFAMVENLLYEALFLSQDLQSGTLPLFWGAGTLMRGLFSTLGHAVGTGLVGYAYGLHRARRLTGHDLETVSAPLFTIGAVGVAILLHASWNGTAFLVEAGGAGPLAIYRLILPPIVLALELLFLIRLTHRARWIVGWEGRENRKYTLF